MCEGGDMLARMEDEMCQEFEENVKHFLMFLGT